MSEPWTKKEINNCYLLIKDMIKIFTEKKLDQIFTADLIKFLCEATHPEPGEFEPIPRWATYNGLGKTINHIQLAKLLAPHNISSKIMTIEGKRRRGYRRDSIADFYDHTPLEELQGPTPKAYPGGIYQQGTYAQLSNLRPGDIVPMGGLRKGGSNSMNISSTYDPKTNVNSIRLKKYIAARGPHSCFIPFDGETCMPLNTENFGPEDWKEAMRYSALLLEAKYAARARKRVALCVALGVLVAGLAFLAGMMWSR